LRTHLISLIVACGLTTTAVQPAWAFIENKPPTFANGSVDPNRTGDPPAVAAAQRALDAFFGHTNREYSVKGYANPWLMREELGNRQSNWLNQTLPLACGRLVSGWKNRNWIPGRGWQHEAPPPAGATGATVPCEFRAPTFANGGVDPNTTADPATVAAAQKALDDFYRETNLSYSITGYSNPWTMREELGNEQSAWLDMTLPLASGELVGGWKNRNWIPGKGWRHEAPPVSVARGSVLQASGGETYIAWSPDPSAMRLPADLAASPRRPASPVDDPEAARIMASLGLELGGERLE
jgi:hypothetical protein